MNFREYLDVLEKSGRLLRVKKSISPEFEISAAIKYVAEPKGKGICFERVQGFDVPVVGNIYANAENISLAFGVSKDELWETYINRAENPVSPALVKKSPAQAVVIDGGVDILRTMPVLTHNKRDADPYMTSCVTIARDPETGVRGMGLHRIQVKSKDTLGIYLATPPLSHFVAKAEQLNKPLDIAIVSGVSPAVFFASVFMLERVSATRTDKFEIAGGFDKNSIDLVKCLSVDLEVPADAEFILEGQIFPDKKEEEGPFGESTGYYLTYDNPVAKINLISHRKDPVYHALLPFSREVESLVDVMMLPSLFKQIKKDLPDIELRRLSFMALGETCIAQITKRQDEDPLVLINYLLANPFTKIAIVTDEDVEITNPYDVAWAVSTRVRFDREAIIKKDLPGLMIDPCVGELERMPDTSLQFGKVSKMGIDATKPLDQLERFEKADVPQETKLKVLKLLEGIN